MQGCEVHVASFVCLSGPLPENLGHGVCDLQLIRLWALGFRETKFASTFTLTPKRILGRNRVETVIGTLDFISVLKPDSLVILFLS